MFGDNFRDRFARYGFTKLMSIRGHGSPREGRKHQKKENGSRIICLRLYNGRVAIEIALDRARESS